MRTCPNCANPIHEGPCTRKKKPVKLEQHLPADHGPAKVPALDSPSRTPSPGSAGIELGTAYLLAKDGWRIEMVARMKAEAEVERLRGALERAARVLRYIGEKTFVSGMGTVMPADELGPNQTLQSFASEMVDEIRAALERK